MPQAKKSNTHFDMSTENSEQGADNAYAMLELFNKTAVFDLDGVLICAKHRSRFDEGRLDLEHYIANSTPAQIMRDKCLPMLNLIRRLNRERKNYHVCTARILCPANRLLLTRHEIHPVKVMHREIEANNARDHDLKATRLSSHFTEKQRRNLALIDDSRANCAAAVDLGLSVIHVNARHPKEESNV